ncbi:MAG: ATP/GTP-binding protein [Deinococcales bacterium]
MPVPIKALKLVISGPVGAGKTTFIRTLSETPVVDTDALASEAIGKATTTVAMDFGMIHLEGVPIHLFGTPGQDRFDFMWEVLCQGALGLILLVSGKAPHDFGKARNILEFITSRIPVPFVIGVTHQDEHLVWSPEDVADYFQLDSRQVVGLNATDQESSLEVLVCLLQAIERQQDSLAS